MAGVTLCLVGVIALILTDIILAKDEPTTESEVLNG